jgi:hypothetical protein
VFICVICGLFFIVKGLFMTEAPHTPTNFIHEAVAEDLRSGRFTHVKTRLPPEPNGYLHIGHVKAFLIPTRPRKRLSMLMQSRKTPTG